MRLFCFIATVIFFTSAYATAADPVLFYSDLSSAPNTGWQGSSTKGAAVTVWGLNFGSAESVVGTVNITTDSETTQIGDTDSSHMVEWGATSDNPKLNPWTTIERITFHLNSSMSADSAANISVTIDGVTSNILDFGVRALGSNNIYFIDDDGADSNDGIRDTNEGGSVGPWATLNRADPSENHEIDAGDIIYIRSGTYSTIDADSMALDWRKAADGGAEGTATHPIAFVGYPGDVYPTFSVGIMGVRNPSWASGSYEQIDYVTLAKLKSIGDYKQAVTWWGDGWRLVGLSFDWTNSPMRIKSAPISPVNCEDGYILGMKHVGGGYDSYGHVVYTNCSSFEDNRGDVRNMHYAYNEIDGFNGPNNPVGGGAFNFRTTDGVARIENIYIYNNYMHDSPNGWFFYSGENGNEGDYYIYNNLLVSVGTADIGAHCGIQAGYNSNLGNYYLYNNTLYEVGTANGAFGAVCCISGGADWYSKNNIIHNSSGYMVSSTGGGTLNSDHDVMHGGANQTYATGAYEINNNITSGPNLGSGFELQKPSGAIGNGTPAVADLVTIDLFGTKRGRYYDIGAIQYGSGNSGPNPSYFANDNSSGGCFIGANVE